MSCLCGSVILTANEIDPKFTVWPVDGCAVFHEADVAEINIPLPNLYSDWVFNIPIAEF